VQREEVIYALIRESDIESGYHPKFIILYLRFVDIPERNLNKER